MEEQDAALYEAPFAYVKEHVKPTRAGNREAVRAEKWWRFGRPRPELRRKLGGLDRFIATPETAKHRFFVCLETNIAPEHRLVVIPDASDAILGILSSRIHVLWALSIGGTLEDRPVYNSTLCFDAFPFPGNMAPGTTNKEKTISAIAHHLDELRNNWLNPPEWVDWVHTPEEEKAGLSLRPVAKPGHEADLKKRTLTNLYNMRPAWLDNIHKELDMAVATAYGWTDYTPEMPDEEILRRLLQLNLQRFGET